MSRQIKGLNLKPSFNELINELDDEIIHKYPDRRAYILRNSHYMTQLDGEGYMEALNMQQKIR